MRRTLVGAGWLTGAALFLLAFRIGAEWGADYAVAYGSFPLSKGEASLRLNLLLYVLPAALAAAWGLAVLAPERLAARFDGLADSGRAWDLALGVWLLVATWGLRLYVLGGTEITDDENAYQFQARLLEAGKLFVPSLPEPFRSFLDNQFIVNDGRRYAAYFLGHPAWLALFRRLGLPDLAGPVATAAAGLLGLATARRLFGPRVAVLTAGLLATSPFLLLLGATHLSQPTSGLFISAYCYALVRLHEQPARSRWWALAAAAISVAVLTRPQTAAGFFLVGGGAVAAGLWRGRLAAGLRPVVVGISVGTLGLAAFLWLNAARSGSPLRTPYAAYMAQGAAWIFPVGPIHSLRQAAEGLSHLQFWLFGWPVSFLFLPFFRRTGLSFLALGMVGATTLLFAATAVPTVAPVGPVYFGECIPILAMLSASGVERVAAWARERFPRGSLAPAVAAAPVALAVFGMVTFVPPQVLGLGSSTAVARLPYQLAAKLGERRIVVFAGTLPTRAIPPWSWAYYHRNPDPDLADPVLFVRDQGPDRDRQFLEWLQDRKGFVLARRDGRFLLEPLERR